MHTDRLGGPVWVFLVVVMVLALGLAVFVVADAVRRMIRSGPDERPWLLFYACCQGLYLLLLAAAQTDVFPRELAAVVAVATPLALVQSIAYLLRVVFPKRPERTPGREMRNDEDENASEWPPPHASEDPADPAGQ